MVAFILTNYLKGIWFLFNFYISFICTWFLIYVIISTSVMFICIL